MYAAGYSGGGRMVSQFACEHPELLAAIAPVAGLRAGAPLTVAGGVVPDPATCAPSQGVRVITFNGTADPVNPFAGGGAPYWGYGALAASQRWAEINGCHTRKETRVSPNVSLVTHRGCPQNAVVQQYVVHGGGHTWPGGNVHARHRVHRVRFTLSADFTAATLEEIQLSVDEIGDVPTRELAGERYYCSESVSFVRLIGVGYVHGVCCEIAGHPANAA